MKPPTEESEFEMTLLDEDGRTPANQERHREARAKGAAARASAGEAARVFVDFPVNYMALEEGDEREAAKTEVQRLFVCKVQKMSEDAGMEGKVRASAALRVWK